MAVPNLKMNNGQTIPQIALGLWQNKDKTECIDAVNWALQAGYRHFDSAQYYQNEEYLGEAVHVSDIPRKDIFITTKISNPNQDDGKLMPSFERSLKKLGDDYVDLLLLHFPVTGQRQKNWPLMEQIYESGRAKSIGVSNYTVKHLEELLKTCKIKPAVNQVELHVFLQQPDLLKYCKDNEILVEAYCPLVRGERMDNPVLQSVAKKHGKTVAQVEIRWCIDAGTVPLPKSSHQDRINQNLDVFDFKLDADDMAQIAKLDENYHITWDPTEVE